MKNLLLFLLLPFAFSATSCNSDSCENKVCQHNGVCESGDCLCSERYTGELCEKEVVPSAVKIKAFNVKTHEIKPNGDPWDDEPGDEALPDVYFKILDADNNLFISFEGFHLSNITNSTTQLELELPDVTSEYTLLVFDEDGVNDDLIYELSFTPYQSGQNFPPNITEIYYAANIPPQLDGELTINLAYCFE